MIIKPTPPRHTVEHLENGIKVILPSKRNLLRALSLSAFSVVIILMTLVVVLFIIVFSIILWQNSSGSSNDIAAKLMGFVCAFAMFAFPLAVTATTLYNTLAIIWGKEEVVVNPQTFTLIWRIFRWKKVRVFSSELLQDLRIYQQHSDSIFRYFGETPLRRLGLIAFDYGAKTYNFGYEIDEAEAKQIIAALQPYLTPEHSTDL